MTVAKSEEYYSNTRAEVLPFLPKSRRRVIEIGCGDACFAEYAVRGTEYWAVEPCHRAAQKAMEKGLGRVLLGTFSEVTDQLPDAYFDLVICNDVMEHMPDHEAFLSAVRSKMASGGYLVGSVPNVRYVSNLLELLVRRDWRYREDGILDRTHLRFFTERSLRRTLEECGYCVEELKGINPWDFSPPSLKERGKKMVSRMLGGDTRFRQFGFRARAL